ALRAIDLTGRERQLRAAMQAMAQVAARFARSARRTLPWMVRAKSRLLPQPVSIIIPAGDAVVNELGPSFDVVLEAEELPAWATISIGAVALRYVLDGSLGAKIPGAGELGPDLTLAQRAVVARVARAMTEDLILAVREEVGLKLNLVSARARSAQDPPELPGADGLRVDCLFDGMPDEPTISIAISAEALETAAREHHEESPVASDPRMEEAMRDVAVEVRVELGKAVVGLRSVLELRPGQVLRLSTALDDPALVLVGGIAKYAGRPVVSRGQLAVEIRGRLEG
ncbi:MAG TPA: FliM/FliN family flagellar motor C-terminal domain-containing protein, partial [Polyangiaceae bacterium]|nr:FliM/FliN family flagellar motor C-terminal domain-containing protein [Polyangiaceae bacterium]